MNSGDATRDEASSRVELLLFTVGGGRFAIPVAQVREVQAELTLTPLPNAHPLLLGLVRVRGRTFPAFDLQAALDGTPCRPRHLGGPLIVTELTHSPQGILVERVERIVVVERSELLPAPPGSGRRHLIAGVVRFDDHLVELLDLKVILAEAIGSLGEHGEHQA